MAEQAMREAAQAVQAAIASGDQTAVADLLAPWRNSDAATILHYLEQDDIQTAFAALPEAKRGGVFAKLDAHTQLGLLAASDDVQAGPLLIALAPDDLTQLLEATDPSTRGHLLTCIPTERRGPALALMGYPEQSIGRLMTPNYIALRPEWTVAEAIDHLRQRGKDTETLHTVFVTDDQGRLLDDIRLRTLVLADPAKRVADIMDGTVRRLSAHDDQEKAVRAMARYDVFVLPVVDDQDTLLGVVTVDDVLDVQQEEATEDFHIASAVQPLQRGYRSTTAASLFRARIPWLLVLIGVGLMSASVIDAFESTLSSMLVLAIFIPLLIGSGGNTGAQAATIMIRAMATGEVHRGEGIRAIRKELLVGIGLGAAMAIAVSALGYWFGGITIALIVAAAMFTIVLMANLLGVLLPMLFTRMGRDPAMASSPLIATLVDVTGLLVYFGIATWVLTQYSTALQ